MGFLRAAGTVLRHLNALWYEAEAALDDEGGERQGFEFQG